MYKQPSTEGAARSLVGGQQGLDSAHAEGGHMLARANGLGERRKSESDLVAAAGPGRLDERLDFRDPCFVERQARPTPRPACQTALPDLGAVVRSQTCAPRL